MVQTMATTNTPKLPPRDAADADEKAVREAAERVVKDREKALRDLEKQ